MNSYETVDEEVSASTTIRDVMQNASLFNILPYK